jgi:hypothetical protein
VVHGVNQSDGEPQIISCASCTTNCITPVIEIAHRRIGVQRAVMTTIHAYTAGQQLIDGPSKSYRRGRAGAANLVPTSTGAAQATTRAVPELADRFDGIAVRAPIIDPEGKGPAIGFLRVPEGKTAKNRMHIDIRISGEPTQDTTERRRKIRAKVVELLAEGAVEVRSQWYGDEFGHVVMRDPEGNEFCVA